MKTRLGDLIADANWEAVPEELAKQNFPLSADEVAAYNEITDSAVAENREYTEEEVARILVIEELRLGLAMSILRGFINPEDKEQ